MLTSKETLERVAGKRIETVRFADDQLTFVMEDGSQLSLSDAGQNCCETRYMTCDDALSCFTGDKLLGWEIADAPNVTDKYGEHEVQFLRIHTTGGDIVCETHNIHNGYYGGFAVRANYVEAT